MFSHLTNFGYQRSGKEAVGFYFAYVFFFLLLGILAGGITGLFSGEGESTDDILNRAAIVGNIIAVIATLFLGHKVLKQKGQLGNFTYLLLLLVAGILALFGGAVLGFIPVAYLTTKGKMGMHEEATESTETPVTAPAEPAQDSGAENSEQQ